MKHRFWGWVLCALCLFSMTAYATSIEPTAPLASAAPVDWQDGDLTREQAWTIARSAWTPQEMQQVVIRYDNDIVGSLLTFTLDGHPQQAWHFVILSRVPGGGKSLSATVLSPSGEIYQTGAFPDSHQWEAALGPYLLWTAQQRIALYHLSGATGIYAPSRPGSADLTEAEARRIGNDIVLQRAGLSPEEMQRFTIGAAFSKNVLYDPDVDFNGNMWHIGYFDMDAENPQVARFLVNLSAEDGTVMFYFDEAVDGPSQG